METPGLPEIEQVKAAGAEQQLLARRADGRAMRLAVWWLAWKERDLAEKGSG